MEVTVIDCSVKIGTTEIPGLDVHDVLVESDLDQPDHAIITLSNLSKKYSETVTEGDDLEIKLGFVAGKGQGTVFKGEVVGIEPIYDARAPQRVHIRGYNRLHRLMRSKKSVTFAKMTDKDIVDKVCQPYGLSAQFGDKPPTIQYDHVYQHNLTDLEFLRMRAARLGYEVVVDDKKLFFRQRVSSDSGIKLSFEPGETVLERFMPRLSMAHQVTEVKVFGWDPVKKQEIVGSAKPESDSKLGDKTGADVLGAKQDNVLQVVHQSPVSSKEEADNIAKSILNDRMMDFITGDGVCRGNSDLKPGIIVTVDLDDARFKGKYHVTSVRHRYVHAGTSGGYRTEFKFRRDAKSDSS